MRHTKDSYKIMIAEFMLQRTRVEQVESVYNDFMIEYPEAYSLANARSGEIEKFTKHLGLHWRSEHFIKAAEFIVEKYNGMFPDTANKILEIPGIGEYIAGVIMAACFNKSYPIIDVNIARFINRFFGFGLSGEIRRKKEILNIAGKLFNTGKPGEFLFAIIDFAALVCRPVNPECDVCPIGDNCKFFQLKGSSLKREEF